MRTIRMPSLAENVNEATVAAWLVDVGDAVTAGQGVADILTEKAEFTLETECAGTVSALLAPPKSVLPVGTILALLDATPEDAENARRENEAILARHAEPAPAATATPATAPVKPTGTAVRATPAARRVAKELGLDLADVAAWAKTSEPLKEEDVRRFAAAR